MDEQNIPYKTLEDQLKLKDALTATLILTELSKDGKQVTVGTITQDNNRRFRIWEIRDWEHFKPRLEDMINAIPELQRAIKLPKWEEYVRQLASSNIYEEQGEILDQIEVSEENGGTLYIIGKMANLIDVKLNNESILQIRFSKRPVICEECGKIFIPRIKDQRFHTAKCRNRYHQRAWRMEHTQ